VYYIHYMTPIMKPSHQSTFRLQLVRSIIKIALIIMNEISGNFTAVCDVDGNAQLRLNATGVVFRHPAPPDAAGPVSDPDARGSTLSLPAGQMVVPPTPQMRRPDALTLAQAVKDGETHAAAFFRNMDLQTLRKRLTTTMYNIQVRLRYQVGARGEWSPAAHAKLLKYLLNPPRTAAPLAIADVQAAEAAPPAIADGPAAEAPPPAIANGADMQAPPPTADAASDSTSTSNSSEDGSSSTDDDAEKDDDGSEHESNDEAADAADDEAAAGGDGSHYWRTLYENLVIDFDGTHEAFEDQNREIEVLQATIADLRAELEEARAAAAQEALSGRGGD